jgi:hypothetical protein
MAKHPTKLSWTVEDSQRLTSFVENGASPIRAAAALRRTIGAVRAQARLLGSPFPPLRVAREKWQTELVKSTAMKPY